MNTNSVWNGDGRGRGFTLMELLVVVSIMAVLMGLAVPAVLTRTTQQARNAGQVASLLDQARQTAITESGYVWVAFRNVPAANSGSAVQGLEAVMVLQEEGPETDNLWTNWATVDLSTNTAYRQIGPVMRIGQSSLMIPRNELEQFFASLLPESASMIELWRPPSGAVFRVRSAGRTEEFTHAILFTPQGQARVNAISVGQIAFGLKPTTGRGETGAVLRINALTGQNRLLRL